jgi:integrase
MASLRQKENSPYWFACFSLPDGKRTQRSTGVPIGGIQCPDTKRLGETLGELLGAKIQITPKDNEKSLSSREARRLAERIADQFEDAALAGKRFTEARARKTISDIYEISNSDKLESATTGEFLDRWLAKKELEADPNTHTRYASIIKDFKTFLGTKAQRDITSIKPKDFGDFRDEMAKRLAPATVNLAIKILRGAFEAARKLKLVPANEADSVELIKGQKKFRRRAFTLPELKSVLAVANDEWKGAILFGLYTGQRLGDVASLTWANIDLQKSELKLVTEKTGKNIILPLAPPVVNHVMKMPAGDKPDSPLFPSLYETAERQGRVGNLSNQFFCILMSAGLVKKKTHHTKGEGRSAKRQQNALSFHSLRHTATSLLKNAGVSDAVAMGFVGHDSSSVSQVYTHLTQETLKEAAAKLPDITK